MHERKAGVLLHITSLPGPYGIGTMGKNARKFADFLAAGGQSFWQVLPIGPTGFGDSPYQSYSAFAGNPLMIDPDLLVEAGYLHKKDVSPSENKNTSSVDFDAVQKAQLARLRAAYEVFVRNLPIDYLTFCEENEHWLNDYALFMAIKNEQGGEAWYNWPRPLAQRETDAIASARARLYREVHFWQFVQYVFDRQWKALKDYANSKGLRIIGDLPIYVSRDSADAWANPSLFQLDDNHAPSVVAGCPPDAFSETGQLWGNPVYDWKHAEDTNYLWWTRRLERSFCLFDTLRIDHFRGFESYYAIPAEDDTAANGVWCKGPELAPFAPLTAQRGPLPIIAEDLGYLTDDVRDMLRRSGYPGMKVLQFAFAPDDPNNDSMPHNIPENCVVYTGTHDNMTSAQWIAESDPTHRDNCLDYMGRCDDESFCAAFIRLAYGTHAKLAVVPMQDWLGLGGEARMNTPATTVGNWSWRLQEDYLTDKLSKKMAHLTSLFGRK